MNTRQRRLFFESVAWRWLARPVVAVAGGALVVTLLPAISPSVVATRVAQAADAAEPSERVAERPDRVSAALTARVQGSPVEVLSERTETTSLFANPDGSFTAEVAAGPVRVRDGEGWVPVDTTLVPADGGWSTKATPGGLKLGAAGDASFVTTSSRDRRGRAVAVGVGLGASLPAPAVKGNTAVYGNVLPDADLVVTARSDGFSHDLVLRKPPARPLGSLRLPLTLTGLTASVTDAGGIVLADADGKPVYTATQPLMWDARIDPVSGDPVEGRPVVAAVETKGGKSTLVLTPDAKFLADPGTVYPVTIDPTFTQGASDTWLQYNDYLNSMSGSTELKAGTYNGSEKARSFLKFALPAGFQNDTTVLDAKLRMYNWYSGSCTGAGILVRRITSGDWVVGDINWTNQPTATSSGQASVSAAYGYSSGCDANGAYVNWDIDAIAQEWANGAGNWGLKVAADDESSIYTWRKYRSANYIDGAGDVEPKLIVTYNSKPNTPSNRSTVPATVCTTGASRPWINTTTPTLQAAVSDPDGGTVYGNFDVWPTGGTGSIWSANSPGVSSGGAASKQVAAGIMANGTNYSWRVRGYDGALYSAAWTPFCEFTIDLTQPAAPTVSSTTYLEGQWNTTGGAGSFTFSATDTGSGVANWRYWLDANPPTTVAGTTPKTVSVTPDEGWHTLHVQALDLAGNVSDETEYSFGAVAGVTSLAAGQRTQQHATLGAIAPGTASQVRFQYKLPNAAQFADIPTAHVELAGAPLGSWPVATVASGSSSAAPPNLVWDVEATMTGVDGPITVQAIFTSASTSWTTEPVTITLDRQAFGDSYATDQVGPGTVSLLTGNYSVTATDVSVAAWGSDLTVARTFNSLSPTQPGIFGPGWKSSVAVEEAGAYWTGLTDTGGGVVLSDVDGGLTVFAKKGTSYVPQGDAAGLVLSKTASPDEFTVTDLDGSSSTFGFVSGPTTATLTNPRIYRMVRVTQPGSNQTTSYAYNGDGTPSQILAPKPTAGTLCDASTWSPGCRALQFGYATGKLTKVTIKTTDGAAVVKTVDVACYTYDGNGRLSQAWDPRINGTTCAAPVLATSYTYNADGRIATVAPAGLAAWSLGYSSGRLDTITRTHNAANGGGSETDTIRYDVPIGAATTGDESHPDLTAGRVATWAQTDLPVTATAVFGPGDTVSTTDLRDAEVHALNVDGREVNTAAFSGTGQAGWRIATSEHDRFGNQIRALSEANRDLALTGNPTTLGLPAGTTTATFA